MTASPFEQFAIGKEIARNGKPHGVLGAVGQRRIPARETPDNARGVISAETEPDKRESPVTWMHWATHQLERVASTHGCVNRDYRAKLIRDVMAIASDDDCTFDLPYMTDLLIRQIQANKEGSRMDAQQQSLPEPTKPPPAKATEPHWSADPDKVAAINERLKAQGIDIDFARDAAGLKPGEPLSAFRGSGNDFYRAAEAAHKVVMLKRAKELDEMLGPDTPPEPPAQKPAEKAPQSDATPAPVPDVPAPRSDATAAQVAAIAGKPEPTPEPAIVTPATPRYEEWPFVALLTMYSPEGLEMKYTLRAASDAQLLDAERAFVARRLAAGYTTTRQPVTPLPVATPVTPSAPALPTRDAAPVTYAPLPETVATPAAGGTADSKGRTPGQTGTDRIVGITRNEVNRKVTYDLWMATGNYAEHTLRIDEDVARLQAALPTVNLQAMTAGSRYPVALDVTWVVTGKMNGKGTYYHRNVTAIVAVA